MSFDPTIDIETNQRICYYKLLSMSPDEQDSVVMKKLYLKACQKYHPDRNRDNEHAETMFKYLQEAWTTLSSPQERSYYDRNKLKILNTAPLDDFAQQDTSLDLQLLRSTRCYVDFDDSPQGFYTVYARAFKIINEEENKTALQQLLTEKLNEAQRKLLELKKTQQMPEFGDSQSKKEVVKKFYDFFEGFQTVKMFQKADMYSQQGENAKMRKIISLENEKFRFAEREAFNQKIVDLVAYIKRRDPRIQKFAQQETDEALAKQQLMEQLKVEKMQKMQEEDLKFRQNMLSKVSQLQEKLIQNKISPQEMLELEKLTINSNPEVDKLMKQWNEVENAKPVQKEFQQLKITDFTKDKELIEGIDVDINNKMFCKICNQRFGVIGEYKPHLQSKRHKQGIEKMEKEEIARKEEQRLKSLQLEEEKIQKKLQNRQKDAKKEESESQKESIPEFREETVENKKEIRMKSEKKKKNNKYQDSDDEPVEIKPKEKKKPKQEKQPEQVVTDPDLQCKVCKKVFESRTKLFKHLEESKHAAIKK